MGHLPFSTKVSSGMSDVEDYWPRRLLHIPTMTSFERNSSGQYGTATKPSYNILTYTWGRWKVRDPEVLKKQPSLKVKGVPWKIPVVEKNHFTVDAFKAVMERMQEEGIEWAWVDIACIDQEDEAANAQEVGRQAGIFKKARHVYVWLSQLSNHSLKEIFNEIQEVARDLILHVSFATNLQYFPFAYAERLCIALNNLLGDPWFSSLWTLQESILRPDARILSSTAEPVKWDEKFSTSLDLINDICARVHPDLESIGKFLSNLERAEIRLTPDQKTIQGFVTQLTKYIQQSGFHIGEGTGNPNVQYGIAKTRRTSRSKDRIYAIMQIYNLRVGKSARPSEDPALPELVNEFGLAINTQCIIRGQAFIHTEPPSGPSWRITENSTVPPWLRSLKGPRPHCSMMHDPSSNHLRMTGELCLLPDLPWPRDTRRTNDSVPMIQVAADSTGLSTSHVHDRERTTRDDPDGLFDYMRLRRECRSDIWVLILGKVDGSLDDRSRESFYVALLVISDRREWQEAYAGKSPRSNGPCKRVGVCRLSPKVLKEGTWKETTLLLV